MRNAKKSPIKRSRITMEARLPATSPPQASSPELMKCDSTSSMSSRDRTSDSNFIKFHVPVFEDGTQLKDFLTNITVSASRNPDLIGWVKLIQPRRSRTIPTNTIQTTTHLAAAMIHDENYGEWLIRVLSTEVYCNVILKPTWISNQDWTTHAPFSKVATHDKGLFLLNANSTIRHIKLQCPFALHDDLDNILTHESNVQTILDAYNSWINSNTTPRSPIGNFKSPSLF
mmetsp:Transcript_25077/g.50132  ORF Transcript_25077/g.50132 Transcript_25077/m.50132 type:complete len:229 (-) Transcript_25077:3901-4587(-)